MKRSMLSFLFVFYSHFTLSQTPEEIWSVTYPEPDTNFIHIQKMLCDSEGNTYLTGFINRAGKEDYLTIKYNNNGIKLWTATYNSSYDSTDRATDIAVDESGNVYVTGRSIDGGSPNDYLTIKYNSEGVEQWTARFNGSGPYEKFSFRYIALDELGNIYITGTNWGNNIQVWNFVTVKYNNNGTMLWSVHYDVGGSGNTEVPIAIQCDNSGNVIVTGWGLYDYTTVKYNASGVQLWTAEEIINTGEPKGLEIDNSDNVYICGSDSGGNGGFRVIKYNPSGVKLWNVIHLSPGIPSDLTIHSSGYLYVTGSTGSFLTPYATLLKLSSANGSLIWSANYNIPFSSGEYLSTDASGNIYVAANLFNISYNEFSSSLIKYNSSGTKIWNYDYYGTTEDLNPAASVCTDGFGNIYLLSRNEIQENLFTIDEDYTILKFNSGGNQQWNSTPGFDSFNNLSEFNIDNEGNIYATGSVKRIGTNYDILTAKYDSSGSVLWYTFYNGPIDSTDSPSGIFIDDNYNVYVTGQSQGSGTDYCNASDGKGIS